ncbi:MAG: FtsX-like permease family protein [Proteobacteria bacterium]|nr:FtsX-like permease family protein [Pseudomonadota bacterium]
MKLAMMLALRELRGGVRDFRIFISCLVIGVAVIAAVNTVSRQIAAGIRHESKTLLGGDVQLSLINQDITPEQRDYLAQYGRISQTVTMRSMAMHGDEVTLVELKGVDDAYPLLGEATLAGGRGLQQVLDEGMLVGEDALMQRLLLKPGDRIQLADAQLTMADTLAKEPDRITNALTLGPRVMGRTKMLQDHGLLLPAGLTRFHTHVLLNPGVQLEVFLKNLAERFPNAPWITKTVNENNRGVQDFISRLQLFMTLAGLSTLLIGGIGIMNAAETYLARKSEPIAVMKTLGASRSLVFNVYVLILMLITLAGSLVGAVAGSAASHLALPYLSQFLPVFDMRFTLDGWAIGLSVLFGVLTVFSFSIPALARGVEVRPAVLFRGAEPGRTTLPVGKRLLNMVLAVALAGLLIFSSSDRSIALGFIACALVSFVIFGLVTRLVQRAARRVRPGLPWARMAVANLYRPGAHTLSIMLSTGIGLTVLIALLLVESNFQKEVRETMPAVAPSLFLIDIQPAQKDALLAQLSANNALSDISYQPMVRGRIAKAGGVPVGQLPIAEDAKWAIESDRGLTYSAEKPANAVLAEGAWWPSDYHGKPLVSVDRKIARGLGLGIGDSISVIVMGREIQAEIFNLRDVNYISFQINFALILSPGSLDDLPITYIATLRTQNNTSEGALIRDLAKTYPNISAIRIKDSIAQIREMVGHIALALRLCAIVTVLAGVLVLASAMAAMLDSRIYDMVVLKVLGARRADIVKMFLAEWVLLGLLTAFISCGLGMAGAWLILQRLDWVKFEPVPSVIAGTVGLALLCVIVTGTLIHTRVFNTRSSSVLRNE